MEFSSDASRKSKSMEEEKKLPPLQMMGHSLYDMKSKEYANNYNRQSVMGEYRSLTEYNKNKNDAAKRFIEAQKRLEQIEIVKCIGKIKLRSQ
jgi:hypothetical protein